MAVESFDVWVVIFGLFAVTFPSRVCPIIALSGKKFAALLECWLRLIAPAILSALLLPDLLLRKTPSGARELFLSGDNYYLLAAVPTIIVAAVTRHLFWTLLTGMASVAACRFFL